MRRQAKLCHVAAMLFGLAILVTDARVQAGAEPATRRSAGWIEDVWIGDPGAPLAAKLDTGAATSSLHAEGIRAVNRGGGEHVTFNFADGTGKRHTLDAPVVRWTRIKRAGAEPDERPVVRLALCLAGVTEETEFTLADRSRLDYPVLVGRSFLAGRVVVDSALKNTADGTCARSPRP